MQSYTRTHSRGQAVMVVSGSQADRLDFSDVEEEKLEDEASP